MAFIAGWSDVTSDQREAGLVMIKTRLPVIRGVAFRAVQTKAGRDMIGILRTLEDSLMTACTCGGESLEDAVRVTSHTACAHVRTGQRKITRVMIEHGVLP